MGGARRNLLCRVFDGVTARLLSATVSVLVGAVHAQKPKPNIMLIVPDDPGSGGAAIKDLMKTYVQYPPRKQQSESYSGPITLLQYERAALTLGVVARCRALSAMLDPSGFRIQFESVTQTHESRRRLR